MPCSARLCQRNYAYEDARAGDEAETAEKNEPEGRPEDKENQFTVAQNVGCQHSSKGCVGGHGDGGGGTHEFGGIGFGADESGKARPAKSDASSTAGISHACL